MAASFARSQKSTTAGGNAFGRFFMPLREGRLDWVNG